MAKNKTTQTNGSVTDFIDAVTNEIQRKDAHELVKLFEQQTGLQAKMWGSSIVGFGSYHYKYDSGHEGDAPLTAFSPRSNATVLYLASSFGRREELLQKLGKHKTGKGCIYLKKIADVDVEVLKEMITESLNYMRSRYPDHK